MTEQPVQGTGNNSTGTTGTTREQVEQVAGNNPGTVPAEQPGNKWQLRGQRALLSVATILLSGIILSPLSLSAQDIMEWAASPVGLGLYGNWPWVVFYALDATAMVCVLMALYATWRGEAGTIFRFLVWVIAAVSAFANYRHGLRPEAPADAVWFFPAMSLSAPLLLEVVLHHVRRWIKQADGRTSRPMPSFGIARWIPGVGSFKETYCAWRVARFKSISKPDTAIDEYRRLDCGWKVLSAIQAERREQAEQERVQREQRTADRRTTVREQGTRNKRPAQRTVPLVPIPGTTPEPEQVPVPTEQPVPETTTREQPRDEQLLAQIKELFPEQVPSGNAIRTTIGVRYETAKRLREQLISEKELATA